MARTLAEVDAALAAAERAIKALERLVGAQGKADVVATPLTEMVRRRGKVVERRKRNG